MYGASSFHKGTVMNPSALMLRFLQHYVLLRDSFKRERVPVGMRESHICFAQLMVFYTAYASASFIVCHKNH